MGLKKFVQNEQIEQEKDVETVEKEELQEEITVVENQNEDNSLLESTEPEEIETEVTSNDKEVEDKVNEKRTAYQTFYKKQKKVNSLVTVALLAVIVGAFALMLLNEKLPANIGTYIGGAVLIVALAGAFVSSKMLKNKLSANAQDYVHSLYQITNEYLFDIEGLEFIENNTTFQLPMEKFVECHFYRNIKATRNRNFANCEYRGKPLVSCDLAANILIKNRTSPMFLGKFYDYESSYDKDTVILFQLKGGELSRPIDDTTDLILIEGNKKYCIYSNDENCLKVLNHKVITELLKFKVDNTLIDVILSIRKGKVSLGIDYSDEFMNIPVESEFNITNTKRAKQDLARVLKIFDLLNK